MEDLINMENEFSEEELEKLEQQCERLTQRKACNIRLRREPSVQCSEEEFRRRLRSSDTAVRHQHDLIGAELESLVVRKFFAVNSIDSILTASNHRASASHHSIPTDFNGMNTSSVCNITPTVSDKIVSLCPRFIRKPNNGNDLNQAKRNFFGVAGVPPDIGAIDGTIMEFQELGGIQNKTDFYYCMQIYAFNTQITTDANGKIIDIVARWSGGGRDEAIFLKSTIFERFFNGDFIRRDRDSLHLGEGGKRAERYLAASLKNPVIIQVFERG